MEILIFIINIIIIIIIIIFFSFYVEKNAHYAGIMLDAPTKLSNPTRRGSRVSIPAASCVRVV